MDSIVYIASTCRKSAGCFCTGSCIFAENDGTGAFGFGICTDSYCVFSRSRCIDSDSYRMNSRCPAIFIVFVIGGIFLVRIVNAHIMDSQSAQIPGGCISIGIGNGQSSS